MKSNIKYTRLTRALNYDFKDHALVELALSHRSIGKSNNERLEFLGDSLLNLIIAEALFHKFPDAKEGQLSRLRALLVKGETLAEVAREKSLGEHILLGGGELKSGGHRRDSILADVVEALIGAIYLDSNMAQCKERVLSYFDSRLNSLSLATEEKDPKTRLQEYMQERGKPLPVYAVTQEGGQSHAREYTVECKINGQSPAFYGVASSKRNAEKLAAFEALKHIGEVSNDE